MSGLSGFPRKGVAIGLWAVLIACGGSAPDPEAVAGEAGMPTAAVPEISAASTLVIGEPQAHLMPDMGAVYFSVTNPGDHNDRLIAIETVAARVAEFHESVNEDGVMRMVAHPDGFEVPARGVLELQPGGKHVMLVEPRPPAAGEPIRLTLHFERGGTVEFDVPLTATGEMPMEDHSMGGMDH